MRERLRNLEVRILISSFLSTPTEQGHGDGVQAASKMTSCAGAWERKEDWVTRDPTSVCEGFKQTDGIRRVGVAYEFLQTG